MAKSNKPLVWSLFAAGGTLAAFLAPVLVLLFLLVALGHTPAVLSYAGLHAVLAHSLVKLAVFGTITLFLWHAAHRLRITLHDLGVRQDAIVAAAVYTVAALGTASAAWSLAHL
jgi:fumarate reductase subunit D